VGNVINDAMHRGGFLWGLRIDTSRNTIETGALGTTMCGTLGIGLLDARYRFYQNNAPSPGAVDRWNSVTMASRTSGSSLVGGPAATSVTLPIFDASGALLTEFPLCAPTLTATLSSARGCISLGDVSGGRFDECTSNWATAPGVSAIVTVSAARRVQVTALRTTLCNLLAGTNCETMPEERWMQPPDTMGCGERGWSLQAQFAAVSAQID
jgi:hypothetical protein